MKLNQTILIIPLSLMLLSSCGNKKGEQQTKTENRNVSIVLVANPQKHQFSSSLQISGTAKPNQQVKLFAMTNGMLREVNVDIGDFVKQGQTLATLDNPDLIQQKAKAEADLNGKKSIYDRLKSVYDKTPQLTTIAEVEKAQAEFESAKATMNALTAQVGFLNIQAPFAGVIVNRYFDKGATIQSGLNNSSAMPLFELQDLQPIRLTIDVSETDAVLIDKNTKAAITFPELPNAKYSATVSRIAYGLDETTKTMTVQIDLPNTDLKIRSGMYAKVEIQRSGHKDVLSVPNEAIGNVKGQSYVYVVNDGKVKKVEVKTGLRDDKFSELLNADIKPTDKIVVQGKEFCLDGATVQTKDLNTK
jgi:membrane fusion protein (multidrug efflux system)